MFRFVGLLVVLGGAFGLGYYAGQYPVDDVKQTVISLSRHALDSALGMGTQQDGRWREELIEAKGQVIQAKSDLMDRNFGNAADQLAGALTSLEAAERAERNQAHAKAVRKVAGKIREAKLRLAGGKVVSRSRLDHIQGELETLLTR